MSFKYVSLYSLAEWKNGLAFKQIHFAGQGKPVIKIAELKNGITAQTAYTQQTFDDSVYLTKGDMVFSWSGNPETSIDVFWYNLPNGWLNQHIFKVTPNEGVHKLYLYYLLKSLKPQFTAIASNKQTTGLGHVTIRDMKEMMIELPDYDIQKSVGEYLYSIDQKVCINQRINDNLEQQAQAIFSERFEKVSSEDLPAGWRVVSLGEVATISNKSFNPLKEAKRILEHYSIPAFDEARFPVFEPSTSIKSNKFVIDSNFAPLEIRTF